MQITTKNGKLFWLTAESAEDRQFIDALDLERFIAIGQMFRKPEGKHFVNSSCTLLVDGRSEAALVANSQRKAFNALTQLFALGLAEAARDGHVGANAPDPQLQKALAAMLEKLELVLQTFNQMVVEQKALKEMVCTQSNSPGYGAPIVVAAGA